jgi:CelD/BcsL family acetyltransferase involved in cellulose biosynthesis
MARFACGALPAFSLSLYQDAAKAAEIWLKFQMDASSTPYQTYQWCNTWQRTVGRKKTADRG